VLLLNFTEQHEHRTIAIGLTVELWDMPGKVKVRVVAGRGLPVMDRSTDLTDAYVEVNKVLDLL
jgi:hypothetical protein